jgi:hypothetical protein
MTITSTTRPISRDSRPSGAAFHSAGFMLAAYVLSVVYTVTTVLDDTAPPDFGADDVLTYAYYVVSFAFAALALRASRRAQVAVGAFLALQLAVGVLVYPDDFGPEQQTTWGWFENDAFMCLLAIALYITVKRVAALSRP